MERLESGTKMRIKETTLQNGDTLAFGDFNVFIGGNGVSKTTLLVELFSQSTGLTRPKLLWINNPSYETTDINADMALLKGSLARKYDTSGTFYFSQATKNIAGDVDLTDNLKFSGSEASQIESQQSQVLNEVRYRRPFIAFSSCDARLGLSNEVGKTSHDQPAQDAINVLYRDKRLFKKIGNTIHERIQSYFVMLDHTGTNLQLGISDEEPPAFDTNAENIQDEYEKVQRWKDAEFTQISDAGHGIRSMIRLLTSVLDPVNQVIMIDEPEIHLYPAQKKWLGKQLVTLAREQHKQVFLVTHDPMILQGILDANITTNIFRLERERSTGGVVKTCELDRVADANAMRNQDQYLQGLFYQRCVAVEGASDRSFYQNMIDNFEEINDKDLGFISAGGKGNMKHIAGIASKVGLKIAFIFDFDVILFDQSLIDDIFVLMGGTAGVLTSVKTLFEADSGVQMATTDNEKNKRVKELCGFSGKTGMTGTWAQTNMAIFTTAIESLASKGIFIVPEGTLESWASEVEPKVRFAEIAPEVVKTTPALNSKFETFAKKVITFLQ